MKHFILFFVLLLLACSNEFNKAKDNFHKKDYENAINYCRLVAKNDKHYDSAQILLAIIDSIQNVGLYNKATAAFWANNIDDAKLFFTSVNKYVLDCKGDNTKKISSYYDSSRYYLGVIDSISKEQRRKIEKENEEKVKKEREKREERTRFINKIIGKKIGHPLTVDMIPKYGDPETLEGTNNLNWIAYFPEGHFTFIMNKKSKVISFVKEGRIPNLVKPIDIFNETKALYLELMNFKNSNDFKNYGFMPGYKYNAWLLKVEKYENYPEAKNLLKKGIVLGELKMLGLEYVGSKGKETEFTRITRQNFKKALF